MPTYTLPWPPSVNSVWRGGRGRVYLSGEVKSYRVAVKAALLAQGARPIPGKLSVEVLAFPPDRRRRDLDNLGKSLLDALVHAGLIEDDSLIDRLCYVRRGVKRGGEVIVNLDCCNPDPD